MKIVEDNDESTALLEAIKEYESSLGCSLREYNSCKDAQENAQKSLNQREEDY
ncbi:hypothetical protein D3C74_177440 [compost metagenome]